MGFKDMDKGFTDGLAKFNIDNNMYGNFSDGEKLALYHDYTDGGFDFNDGSNSNSMFGAGGFNVSKGLGMANQGMKLFGGLAEMGLFGGTPESRLQEKALNEQIAASKRGFNANATSYNHQVGRADGYNARHGVGPSEKIKKVL